MLSKSKFTGEIRSSEQKQLSCWRSVVSGADVGEGSVNGDVSREPAERSCPRGGGGAGRAGAEQGEMWVSETPSDPAVVAVLLTGAVLAVTPRQLHQMGFWKW